MIVIDSSAIVHALTARDVNPRLLALLADEQLHAPSLLDFEVANSLRGLTLGRKLEPADAKIALATYCDTEIERYHFTALLPELWEVRHNFNAYDGSYLVLAKLLGCPVVTSDAKLAPAASSMQVPVDLYGPAE